MVNEISRRDDTTWAKQDCKTNRNVTHKNHETFLHIKRPSIACLIEQFDIKSTTKATSKTSPSHHYDLDWIAKGLKILKRTQALLCYSAEYALLEGGGEG